MNLKLEFIYIITEVMDIARKYGFKSSREWAKNAYDKGELTYDQLMLYEKANTLRNILVHDKDSNLIISTEMYEFALKINELIKNSKIRK